MYIHVSWRQDRTREVRMVDRVWVLLCLEAEGTVATVAPAVLAHQGRLRGLGQEVGGVELDTWLVAVHFEVAS